MRQTEVHRSEIMYTHREMCIRVRVTRRRYARAACTKRNTANNVVLPLSPRASNKVTISVKIKYSKNVTAIICDMSRASSYAKPHLTSGYAKLLDRRYATYANFVITLACVATYSILNMLRNIADIYH